MGKRSRKGGIPGIEMRLGMNKFERVHLDIKERDEKRRQRREKKHASLFHYLIKFEIQNKKIKASITQSTTNHLKVRIPNCPILLPYSLGG